jgi:O-antigen/teichoic acid export membrane protein
MQKQRIIINAITSVIQVIVIAVVLFLLYRFLLDTIGIEQLGVWSIVIATTSVAQIVNFGLSGSVVKFVAKYVAREEALNVSGVIQTASISITVFIGIILLFAYPIFFWLLGVIIPDDSLHLALSILPFALFAFWIMMITSIFQGGLDGYHRIDFRNFLLMGGALLNLILCYILAPKYGLVGVAYARVIQVLTILVCSWLLLKKCLPTLPLFPFNWNRSIFKEIIGYGMNFQIISISVMLCDPVTKALLSKFGGLSMVGYYEMANRMVGQFRALVVSANQVLVPAIADLKEKTPEKIKSVYQTSYQLLFYLSAPLYSLIIVSLPIISVLWIGHYESVFILFGILLSVGWFLNTLAGPAYFSDLGTGKLRWNVVGHITMALLNVLLGFILGIFFDGFGVVIAWVFSLTLGSSFIYISYHLRNKIPLMELIPNTSRIFVVVCIAGILLAFNLAPKPIDIIDSFSQNVIIIILFSVIIFFPFWLHPMRKRLQSWIISELFE